MPGRGRSAKTKMQGGWVMAVTGAERGSPVRKVLVRSSFAELWSYACQKGLLAVTVDIPIGLPTRKGRRADKEARECLKGPPSRASSVFPAPPFKSLEACTYEEARELARRSTDKGLTRQTYALIPKIKDVRRALCPDALDPSSRPRAAEVHPEVSFRAMAGKPMSFHKSLQAGVAERLALLERRFPNVLDKAVRTMAPGPPHPGLDDVLDALAAAWTARRLIQKEAKRLGGCEKDPEGYPMEIWV